MKTELLPASPEAIRKAGELLKGGSLCAIPTETVYGLAANALDACAVAKIFEAKGRPQDNPLIVHISAMDQLSRVCASVSDAALTLADRFWPGPLTMLLPKADAVPAVVTAGLPSVGVRMPSHEAARAVIDAAGVPLAAPSANASGRPSPTEASHVLEDMDGKIPLIVDGGACTFGVESTVVDMTGPVPRILRPGAITLEMIEEALGAAETDAGVSRALRDGEVARSPGMKYRHYAPHAPVVCFEGAPEDTANAIRAAWRPGDRVLSFFEYWDLPNAYSYAESCDPEGVGRGLFAALRSFDGEEVKRILAQCPRPVGRGAASANRLRRAAAFDCVACTEGVVLGVTGRTGSGKSAFAGEAMRAGYAVLDADAIYKTLLQTDQNLLHALRARFPAAFAAGVLDRRALAQIVFSDERARLKLNAMTHPAVCAEVKRRMAELRAAGKTHLVLDVPLLFESGLDRLCTVTVALFTERSASAARVAARDNIAAEAAHARLNAQPDDAFYLSHCDIPLKNSGSPAQFQAEAQRLLARL